MSHPFATTERNVYGTRESNGLVDARAYHAERSKDGFPPSVYWTTPGLTVTRLRLISDPGFPAWDVSYCHGMLAGKHVTVSLPFHQIPKGKVSAFIIARAREEGVFAKRLGILDCISTCN